MLGYIFVVQVSLGYVGIITYVTLRWLTLVTLGQVQVRQDKTEQFG
jgi:hypothetical protein